MIVGSFSIGEALQLPYEKLKDILSRSRKKKRGKKTLALREPKRMMPHGSRDGKRQSSRAREKTHLQLKRSVRRIRSMQSKHVSQTTRSVGFYAIILVLQKCHGHQLSRRCRQTVAVDGLLLERDELFG